MKVAQIISNITIDAVEDYLAEHPPSGSGDMVRSVYDPNTVEGNAFDMDNMTEGTTTKIMTDTERTKLSGIEALAEVNNISDINAAALTGGGVTALHSHTGGGGLTQQQIEGIL